MKLPHPGSGEDIGSISSRVSREIVQLHARLYGRGPTRAKSYVTSEYLLCVLEDVFLPAERTLVDAGRADHVVATRAAFQEAIQDQFIGVVEEATGRSVRAFISQISIAENLAVELFLYAPVEEEPDGPPTDPPEAEVPDAQ